MIIIRFILAVTIELRATMNQDSAALQPSAMRASAGYLLGVIAATAYMIVSTFPHVIAQRESSGLL